MRRAISGLGLACFFLAVALTAAQSEDYPTRPIRLVVPLPPGGGVDVAARIVGQRLSEALGQQVIIENRPGASGTLGAQAVAKAAADGYTLLFCTGDLVTLPSLMPRMAFDPSRDLVPVTMVSSNSLVVVANANAPFSNVNELIQTAKASPSSLGYATPGQGTLNHVAGEWIATAAGIKLLHIPYRGGPAAVNGVVAGDAALGIVSPPPVQGLVDAGKVKLIGLTGKRPSFITSPWPTLAEQGLPIEATIWFGLFAPAGTPDAVVIRVDQEIRRSLQDAAVRKRMNDAGHDLEPISLAAFAERIRLDAARYERIIRQAGIKIAQ